MYGSVSLFVVVCIGWGEFSFIEAIDFSYKYDKFRFSFKIYNYDLK